MNILHLNTTVSGGAAGAALRLHRALRQAGVDSNFLSVTGKGDEAEHIFSMETDGHTVDFGRRLKQAKRQRYFGAWRVRLHGKPKELFSFPFSSWETEIHPLVKAADVLHLHWVAGMIDIPRFFAGVTKPVVWTLHDAWPFTGGFHYESYFDTKPFRRLAETNAAVVRKAYAGKNISVVAPSAYLLGLARRSGVFAGGKTLVIPNSVPPGIFHPRPGKEVLKSYSIGEGLTVMLFACDELDYYRKGADLLLGAFHKWENKNVRLLVAGAPGKFASTHDDRVIFTGRIGDEKRMAELMSAADLVAHTSREDNLPNVILESLSCGTPVLATPPGGTAELIVHGENGWLATETTEAALLKALQEIRLSQLDRAGIAQNAAAAFSPVLQANRFTNLYRQL